jgi:4-diphosphocytidyl-2-C-methyl-D-erythritol kinase
LKVAVRLTRHAFAKINLDLRVLAVRPDGYHDLATVFQTLALHDTLCFEAIDGRDPLTLTCSDPDIPTDERNLVWRAASALWREAGRPGVPAGVRIDITKRVPPQGGLGGGSANAAVSLVALAQVWGLRASAGSLMTIAAGLGADVPFFLVGGTVRGAGRGDQLECWDDLPDLEVVLVSPRFGVATADAYRWFDDDRAGTAVSRADRNFCEKDSRPHFSAWLRACRNDLEGSVVRHHPAIEEIRERLEAGGALLARMSGSGSTVYGLYPSASAADRAAASLADLDVRVLRTKTLARTPYLREALGAEPGWLPAGSGIV